MAVRLSAPRTGRSLYLYIQENPETIQVYWGKGKPFFYGLNYETYFEVPNKHAHFPYRSIHNTTCSAQGGTILTQSESCPPAAQQQLIFCLDPVQSNIK
jgi:hypothetical protein